MGKTCKEYFNQETRYKLIPGQFNICPSFDYEKKYCKAFGKEVDTQPIVEGKWISAKPGMIGYAIHHFCCLRSGGCLDSDGELRSNLDVCTFPPEY